MPTDPMFLSSVADNLGSVQLPDTSDVENIDQCPRRERLLPVFKRAVHPGLILKDELAELEIKPTEFARQIDVPPNRISQIIAGKALCDGRHRLAVRALVRRRSAILAEPPGAVRPRAGRREVRRSGQRVAHRSRKQTVNTSQILWVRNLGFDLDQSEVLVHVVSDVARWAKTFNWTHPNLSIVRILTLQSDGTNPLRSYSPSGDRWILAAFRSA